MIVYEELAAIFGGTVSVVLAVGATEKVTLSIISLDALVWTATRLSEMFSCSISSELSEESLPLSRTRILEILREDLSLTSSLAEIRGSLPEPLPVPFGSSGEASLERDLENLGENSALRDDLGGSGT